VCCGGTAATLGDPLQIGYGKDGMDGAHLVEKLNRDFVLLCSVQKKDGTVVKDLSDLTYEETVLRLVQLMCAVHQSLRFATEFGWGLASPRGGALCRCQSQKVEAEPPSKLQPVVAGEV